MHTLNTLIDEVQNLHGDRVHETYFNLRELGSGFYSTCREFEDCMSGTLYCIKLGGFFHEDVGGELWLDFCLQNQHLAAVPTIYYHRKLEAGYYIVIMEQLASAYHNNEVHDYVDYITGEDRDIRVPEYIQEFTEAFDDVRDLGMMDLHNENYMLRGETMVIIDPFSQSRGKL